MDKEAFKFLFDTYYNPLCNYVANSLGFTESAEDIVMDVFAHIWQNQIDLKQISSPKSYLFKSVYHKAIEQYRARKMVLISLDAQKIVVPDYKDENADEFMLKEKIFVSIRQLPSQCQRIFVMSKIDSKSNKAIAEELGLSVKTIENQISKALKILRAQITK